MLSLAGHDHRIVGMYPIFAVRSDLTPSALFSVQSFSPRLDCHTAHWIAAYLAYSKIEPENLSEEQTFDIGYGSAISCIHLGVCSSWYCSFPGCFKSVGHRSCEGAFASPHLSTNNRVQQIFSHFFMKGPKYSVIFLEQIA